MTEDCLGVIQQYIHKNPTVVIQSGVKRFSWSYFYLFKWQNLGFIVLKILLNIWIGDGYIVTARTFILEGPRGDFGCHLDTLLTGSSIWSLYCVYNAVIPKTGRIDRIWGAGVCEFHYERPTSLNLIDLGPAGAAEADSALEYWWT